MHDLSNPVRSRSPFQVMVASTLLCLATLTSNNAVAAQVQPKKDALISVSLKPNFVERAIPKSFLGFSIEWDLVNQFIEPEDGRQQAMINLMRKLSSYGGGPLVIRIGGNSQDEAAYDLPNQSHLPHFVHINISKKTLELLAKLSTETGCKFIIGVNLADNRPDLAKQLVQMSQDIIGSKNILGYEFGNEPDFLNRLGKVWVDDTFDDYTRRWDAYYAAVRPLLKGPARIVGPASGGGSFQSHFGWYRNIPFFIQLEHARLSVVALHRYPLAAPIKDVSSPIYTDVRNLLKNDAAASFAQQMRFAVGAASPYGLPVRFGEMNSAAGGGKTNVSDTFASTLWGADTLFEIANAGGAGANFHMSQGTDSFGGSYGPIFVRKNGTLKVQPLFYGMWLFARATQKDSHLIPVVYQAPVKSPASGSNVKIWATESRDNVVRVVILNKNLTTDATLKLNLNDYGGAQIYRLHAPDIGSKNHLMFGGQTFLGSENGLVKSSSGLKKDVIREPVNGEYSLNVDHASAALIVFKRK